MYIRLHAITNMTTRAIITITRAIIMRGITTTTATAIAMTEMQI